MRWEKISKVREILLHTIKKKNILLMLYELKFCKLYVFKNFERSVHVCEQGKENIEEFLK